MAVSRLKTWIVETLTAADLNAEFNNILNNGEDLAWPASKAKDLNGQELILDADADTSITADTDDRIDIRMSGTDLFKFDATVATPVNGLTFTAAAAASEPDITAAGSDTDISINLVPKGAGLLQAAGKNLEPPELIGTTVASSDATIDFTWTTLDYKVIVVYIWGLRAATDDVDLHCLVGSGAGPTFDTDGYAYDTQVFDGANQNNETSSSAAQWVLTESSATYGIGNAAGDFFTGRVELFLENTTSDNPYVMWQATAKLAGITAPATMIGGGSQNTGTLWTAIRFVLSSGNIANGIFTAIGYK